jgi:putative DNA primase/helicase
MEEFKMNIQSIARALGGEVYSGNQVLCPGPGHSPKDRSLLVTFETSEDFKVHSFAGDDWKACKDYVCRTLGLRGFNPTNRPLRQKSPPTQSSVGEHRHNNQNRTYAIDLYKAASNARGTVVEAYLKGRGLVLPEAAPLRYARLKHRQHGLTHCMIARVTDFITAKPIAIHRTFLDQEGNKLDRKALGPIKGGVIRLVPDENVEYGLGLAEGIETALDTMQRFGWSPVWAALNAGNLADLPILSGIESLTVFADNDLKTQKRTGKNPGIDAAEKLVGRYRGAGIEAVWCAPSRDGDFND